MSKKKCILIFVNDSLGELDWIAPFIGSSKEEFVFNVFLYLPKKSNADRERVFREYFGEKSGVVFLNSIIDIPRGARTLDRILNSFIRRIGVRSRRVSEAFSASINVVRRLLAVLCALNVNRGLSFDIVFRDYNLKDSIGLSMLSRLNNVDPKVIIFPHSTAILSNTPVTPKRPPRKVPHDLFFENTELSTKFLPAFESTYTVVGSPSLDVMRESSTPTDFRARSVLFVTRNCDPDFFGFTQADALNVFEECLAWAENQGITVFCKHHPRDTRLAEWRSVQNRYHTAFEVVSSLNDFREPIDGVLSLYTSVGILFTCQGIPVFDVSPYKGETTRLPFHYRDSRDEITHEFIEHGLYARPKNITEFDYLLDETFLRTTGDTQKVATDEIFPNNACESMIAAISCLLAADTEHSQ